MTAELRMVHYIYKLDKGTKQYNIVKTVTLD